MTAKVFWKGIRAGEGRLIGARRMKRRARRSRWERAKWRRRTLGGRGGEEEEDEEDEDDEDWRGTEGTEDWEEVTWTAASGRTPSGEEEQEQEEGRPISEQNCTRSDSKLAPISLILQKKRIALYSS